MPVPEPESLPPLVHTLCSGYLLLERRFPSWVLILSQILELVLQPLFLVHCRLDSPSLSFSRPSSHCLSLRGPWALAQPGSETTLTRGGQVVTVSGLAGATDGHRGALMLEQAEWRECPGPELWLWGGRPCLGWYYYLHTPEPIPDSLYCSNTYRGSCFPQDGGHDILTGPVIYDRTGF